jgi:G3E family GTPase
MKLVLTGGFLGSGKTTAIVNASRILMLDEKKVAVITNDQGDQQVDGAFIKSIGIPVMEVPNGCFCCNYHQLDAHLEELKKTDPDIIFAESVGSCTDLIATIAKPLSKFKPELEVVISIFADAELLSSVLEGRSSFVEESVRYIYKKQIAEADLLILNKIDLLSSYQLKLLDEVIRREYPGKFILHQNSFDGTDIAAWLEKIYRFTSPDNRRSLDINYEIYGQGEAQLAWLDKTIKIHATNDDALSVTECVISLIADQIQSHHLVIGHLKFFVESEGIREKVSFTSTSSRADIKLKRVRSREVSLMINARVETDPATLGKLVEHALSDAETKFSCNIVRGKWSAFKPGFPRPTHRVLV